MTIGHRGGMYEALYMLRNSEGLPVGTVADPESIANGTTMHAYRLTGPISAGALSIQQRVINWTGGMRPQGSRQVGIASIGSFELVLSAFDETFNALITRSVVDDAITTDYPIAATNAALTDPPQGMLVLSVGEKRSGVNGFRHFMYPNVQVSIANEGEGNQNVGDNPLPLRYTVTVDFSEITPFGIPFADTELDVENDIDICTKWWTRFPIHCTSYKADTSDTSFTLGYQPLNTEHDGAKNAISLNKALGHSDVTNINGTSGAVTINSATAADFFVMWYETLWRAVA